MVLIVIAADGFCPALCFLLLSDVNIFPHMLLLMRKTSAPACLLCHNRMDPGARNTPPVFVSGRVASDVKIHNTDIFTLPHLHGHMRCAALLVLTQIYFISKCVQSNKPCSMKHRETVGETQGRLLPHIRTCLSFSGKYNCNKNEGAFKAEHQHGCAHLTVLH